jgi:radical SAM protein with 4Fe4S-binding SPASM domain
MSAECEQGLELTAEFSRLKEELSLWARIQKFPLTATFEITPLCNLRCPMCYVRLDHACMAKQGKLMSAAEWLEIARQTRDMGTLFVTLTGGEPFLHPGFWEIYNGMTEMGLLTNIYTNGCLIDEAVVEKLKANPPHNIKISVYGASDETYEKMCGVKDGFTRVSHAIDLLKEAGLPFFCSCTAVRENIHDLFALYKFAAEKQIKFMHTTSVTLSARGALSDPLSSRTTVAEQGWTLPQLEKIMRPRDLRPFAFCGAYGITYFMTWHGRMQFCGFAPDPCAKVQEPLDLKASWEKLREVSETVQTPEECKTCEHYAFCMRCPGLLASESGDPSKISETFCRRAIELHAIYDRLKAEEAEKNGETGLHTPE